MNDGKVDSIKDEKVVFARGLGQRKERLASRCTLAEGWEQIRWVGASSCVIKYLLIHDKLDEKEVGRQLPGLEVPVYSCSDGILKKVTRTNYLIPSVAVVSLEERTPQTKGDVQVVFDGVQDFGNIGTIVRTAAAFGIQDFAATSSDFDLFQRKTVDASRGTVFSAHCENFLNPVDAVQQMKRAGYQVIATALEGSTIQSIAKLEKKPIALVLGNESSGVSREVLEQADLCIQIPMATQLDSLNVGVAAGISLYELKLKMVMMMLQEKVQGSLGRNLSATSRWLRRLFDVKLRAVCELSADQAVVLMILACDTEGQQRTLLRMAGIDSSVEPDLFPPLIDAGYLLGQETGKVSLTEKGKALLGQIWTVHENVENAALTGFSGEERVVLMQSLTRIQENLKKEVPYE